MHKHANFVLLLIAYLSSALLHTNPKKVSSSTAPAVLASALGIARLCALHKHVNLVLLLKPF
jgi:hypothetical protein